MSAAALTISEVLDNLNNLVEADSLEEIEVTPDDRFIVHKEAGEGLKDVYWINAGADDQTLHAIKKTFSSAHEYIKHSYQRIKAGQDPKRIVEGINNIMVLIGEAAKKLERMGLLFQEKISEMQEFRELQHFYRQTVIRETYKHFMKTPLPKVLEEDQEVEEVEGIHILNDLDVIRRDHLYELFHLKNEAGNHFYTEELAKKMKLACDFGEFADEYFGDDPLLQIKNWEDLELHHHAKELLQRTKKEIKIFWKEAGKYKNAPLVTTIQEMLLALMLASNPKNLIRQFSLKGAHRYFQDFLIFLRDVLHHREYQKILLYPEQEPFFSNIVKLIHHICYGIYSQPGDGDEQARALQQLTKKAKTHPEKGIAEAFFQANHELVKAFKKHPSGPVFKTLDIIREAVPEIYDPLMQGNLPSIEFTLEKEGESIGYLRTPAPVVQEFIHKATIIEEWKTYLRAHLFLNEKFHHLMFNFHDRTSWREYTRSNALEELSRNAEYTEAFTVVTLTKDTEFYHQTGIYKTLTSGKLFIETFVMHLQDEGSGYYFPPEIKEQLFPDFAEKLCNQIHKSFFDKHDLLSIEDRQNFIEIAYALLELKIIEIKHPTVFSLTGKDGLDLSATASVALLVFLQLDAKKAWKEEELDRLIQILFGPTMMIRERVIHPERFDRLYPLLKLLESKKGYLKGFGTLFSKETLKVHPKY